MAEFNAITLQSGVQKQIHQPDLLIVGAGVDTDTAATLTIGGTNATALSLAKNTTVTGSSTFATGTGAVTINGNVTTGNNPNFDFSGSTGTFATSSGANSINGTTTVASGKGFSSAGGAAVFDWSASTGAFSTSSGANTLNGNTTISDGYSFTTGSGTVTINGATVFAGVGVTATGAGVFDFSGSTGAFKTSTGSVTIGPGAVTVSGLTTFTASGTALTVNNNATITGVTTATGGVLTSSVDTAAAGTLSLGTTTANKVNIGTSGNTVEIMGNLKVDGTETVIGTSTFQNNVTIDGNVTVTDGYSFTFGGTSSAANAADVFTAWAGASSVLGTTAGTLTLDGYSGILLQKALTTYLDIGVTTPGVMLVPSGVTLEATGTGQIIATSSSGVSTITVSANTSAVGAVGDAVYVSGSGAVSSGEANSLTTSYIVGFAKDQTASGNIFTTGLVTPNLTGTPSAGNLMYLDPANPGKVTATPPSTTGQVVLSVGIMLTGTQMLVQIGQPVVL